MFFSRLMDPVVQKKPAASKATKTETRAPVDVKAVLKTPVVSNRLSATLSAIADAEHAKKKAELAEIKEKNPLRYYAIKCKTFLAKRNRPKLLAALKQLATVAYDKEKEAKVVIPKGCDADQTANRLVDVLMPASAAVQRTPQILRWLNEAEDANKVEFNNKLERALEAIIYNPALAVAPAKAKQHK